jgi:hypothetical protein
LWARVVAEEQVVLVNMEEPRVMLRLREDADHIIPEIHPYTVQDILLPMTLQVEPIILFPEMPTEPKQHL